MAVFPSSLDGRILKDGFSSDIESNVLRTDMDVLPAKTRRKSSIVVRNFAMSLFLTASELLIFEEFFTDTIHSGADLFQWYHPYTKESAWFRFVGSYTYSPKDLGYVVSFKLELIP